MILPQYFWQLSEPRGGPIIDIPEEEFDERLEAMISYLAALESEEAIP